jgi:hypothetical protein
VGQAHRAEEGREDEGVREVQRVVTGERLGPVDRVEATDRRWCTACHGGPDEEEDRGEQREQLEPVVERLHQGHAAHPARQDVERHDDSDDDLADPERRAGEGAQGESRTLELRDEVEHADGDDEQAGGVPRPSRLDAQLGEVGQRVGARAPERRGDEYEQQQVARRPPDRQPEHVDTAGEDEAGDAEERGGREVLPADRRRVEHRTDDAGGDVEVAHRPGDPQAEGADRE